METISTNRDFFFNILDEVTKELSKKIQCDDTNPLETVAFNEMDDTVKWYLLSPPEDEDADSKPLKKRSYVLTEEKGEDDHPWHGFNYDSTCGMLAGLSWTRLQDTSGNRSDRKTTRILVVATRYERKDIILRTPLKWFDHFRPSVIRLKRLVKRAKAIRIRNKAHAIERQLAHMVPDRIDNILLNNTEIK